MVKLSHGFYVSLKHFNAGFYSGNRQPVLPWNRSNQDSGITVEKYPLKVDA